MRMSLEWYVILGPGVKFYDTTRPGFTSIKDIEQEATIDDYRTDEKDVELGVKQLCG